MSNKFLACDSKVNPFNDKSKLDYLGFDILIQMLKYFKRMEKLNKMCLVSKKMKTLCCNNKSQIFVNILKYLGYTKKITKDNAEIVFIWINSESKTYMVKIGNFLIDEPFGIYDEKSLASFIIETINNKIVPTDINNKKHYKIWWFYPVIYYYTSNANIKKYILSEYNNIKRELILGGAANYYFVNNSNNTLSYINNVLIPKLSRLTHLDIKEYANLVVNSIKRSRNQFIDY